MFCRYPARLSAIECIMPINMGQFNGTLTKTIPNLNHFLTFTLYTKR